MSNNWKTIFNLTYSRLENSSREKMRHLHCLVFVRPTADSIDYLIDEMRSPKYASYQFFFTNVVKKSALERLAESDDHEVVSKVQEIFADFYIINSDLYSINLTPPPPWGSQGTSPEAWNPSNLTRTVDGLFASLLALKKIDPLIRYDRNSPLAKKLAAELVYKIKQESQLFSQLEKQQLSSFGGKRAAIADTPPVLLIIDRKNDPVTPLLTPWTYQAMVHEHIGIVNNRVDMSKVPDVDLEQKEVVLSADQDPFFKKTMYLNFGDLGASIKDYVGQYQAKTKLNKNIESIDDMKRFVQDYPEFRRLSGNVSKHVAIVSELSRLIGVHDLLQVSQLEQSLACNDTHNNDLKLLQTFIQNETLPTEIKLRLVVLYALRYQHHSGSQLSLLIDLLSTTAPDNRSAARVQATVRPLLEKYAGSQHRQEPLYAVETGFFARAQTSLKGLKGVENMYTQHTPLLEKTLSSLIKGRLKRDTHPYMDPGDGTLPSWASNGGGGGGINIGNSGNGGGGAGAGGGGAGDSLDERPQDIIVFMVGGATYEEARLVAEINASTPGVRIVLGSTSMINSKSFLDTIENSNEFWSSRSGAGAGVGNSLRDASPATRLQSRLH